ncbi:agmatinase [Paraburkholderia nemoris]|uniref:Agmatinase n=1 Tax=Paraburkholderia nemoris TaxID=2793076 RepID=A0ABM8R130_9BURK|nr:MULTISPECIES: agmatinase [Paraburkholderia]CAE6726795.1 Agmatinase [Paraburkholderia nemoris]CAE6746345.1 Agmatinase [Paraburkholderia nemoris]
MTLNLNALHPASTTPAAGTDAAGQPHAPTYAGVLSFMRRPYTRDLTGVDVAVSGIPLDLATTFRPGTRFGPAGMRAASVQLAELGAFPWGIDPFDHLNVVDYGDCWFDAHKPLGIRDAIIAHAREILATGTRMLTLGGDHYITYPLLIAHAEKYGKPLSLIHFDAHCDTWPDDNPDSLNHGTMFYKAIREGLIDPARSVQIGIRTWNEDFMGVRILDAPWVHRNGTQATIDEVLSIVGDAPTYLTFDIDCLDPAFAPGTGTPVAGGLSSAQALEIVRALGAVNLVGADVVEVSPPYDHSDVTALAAAHLAADMLCLMRNQKLQRHQRM